MFSLSFRRDPTELRELPPDPSVASAFELLHILMRQSITFRADDAPILDDVLVPLFCMAAAGLDIVTQLRNGEPAELLIPEGSLKLTFLRRDDSVTVSEFIYSREGYGSYRQLLEEWERFAEEARVYLLSEFPGLAQHPEVGDWFRGEQPLDK